MKNSNITCYVRAYIREYDITAHLWICKLLTETECEVLQLLLKGYTITQISKSRGRSIKTVSLQKYQIYKKLGIRNDITFWFDLLLSSCVKIKLVHKNTSDPNSHKCVKGNNMILEIKEILYEED